ncbi:MAG: hypothetical protein INR73_17700 [Williamsia sp.]|nr:hypothetical protein [Williamsia sp.]
MKQIAQAFVLLLVNAQSLQIILTIGAVLFMLKMSLDKLKTARSSWKIRKRKKALHSDMWAIE